MEKQEMFEQAIQTRFKDHNKEDLLTMGIAIGTNQKTLKNLYIAYSKSEAKYENNPKRGVKIEVEFNFSEDEVLIKRSERSLKFSREEFLVYLNLVMLCFGEIYPVGSVLELDKNLLTKDFIESSGVREGESTVRVMVTDRFVPISEDNDEYFIDYLVRLPYGDQSTIFLNRVLIKGMVHDGLVNESEEELVQEELRKELVASGKRSVIFFNR